MPRDAEVLGQVAHELATIAVPRGQAEQFGIARRFADDAEQGLDEGRLARTVAAQEAKNLAPLDAEADALKGFLPFAAKDSLDVSLAKILGFNGGVGHDSFLVARRSSACFRKSVPRPGLAGFQEPRRGRRAIGVHADPPL